jgi:hypothetical protein
MDAMVTSAVLHYLLAPKVFFEDIAFIRSGFQPFTYFLLQWLIISAALCFIGFPAVKQNNPKSLASYLIYISGVIVTVATMCIIPVYFMMKYQFHNALKMGTTIEQMRHLMKFISFVVEVNNDRVCDKDDDPNNNVTDSKEQGKRGSANPTLKSFVYFLFAPTMIYQDEYPKSNKPTNWTRVASYAAQFFFSAYMGVVMHRRFIIPAYSKIGAQPLTGDDVAAIFLISAVFAFYFAFIVGYGFLHCWQNIFAEIMDFGDRMFYKNWFLAKDVMDFLRLWNYLIHIWIVRYIYQPALAVTSKPFAIFIVMALAGIVHDYFISMTGEYFLIYETLFIPIVLIMSCWNEWRDRKKPDENTLDTVKDTKPGLTVYASIVMFVLVLFTNMYEFIASFGEYYAVKHCPRTEYGWRLLIPRILTCPSYNLDICYVYNLFDMLWLYDAI